MLVNSDHLKSVTEQNIHIVRSLNSPERLMSAAEEAARSLSYHLAVLRGQRLSTEREVLAELARELHFPEREEPNWNSVRDFIGDLGWLLSKDDAADPTRSQPARGVVVLLHDPGHLFRSNAVELAFLVDALGSQSQHVVSRGIPFHVIIGPMPEDYRCEVFLNLLSVSSHFCDACQMVDGDCEANEGESVV